MRTLDGAGLDEVRKVTELPRWPAGATPEVRLELLHEESLLRDQVAAYGYAFDAGDLDAVMEFFADDCIIVNASWRVRPGAWSKSTGARAPGRPRSAISSRLGPNRLRSSRNRSSAGLHAVAKALGGLARAETAWPSVALPARPVVQLANSQRKVRHP
jgi:hypothetical protein